MTKWYSDKGRRMTNSEKTAKYFSSRPEKKKAYKRSANLRVNYGITIDEWEDIFNKQDRKCAICLLPEAESKRRMSTDHCHRTGKIRGILCHKCNRGIGLFNDDPERLEVVIQYLR